MQEPTNTSTPQPTSADSTKTISTTETTVATTETVSSPEATPVTVSTDTSVSTNPPVMSAAGAAPTAAVAVTRSLVLKQYGIAFFIVAIMGGVLWYLLEKQGRVETGVFDKITSLVRLEPAAVKVNGEKIPQSLYQKNYEQLSLQAASQGANVTDPATTEQIKKQTIDVLVNSALLKQAARNAGIVVTDEQITSRYQGIVDAQGGEEALASRMAELNITKDGLMQDIEDEILIQTHLDATIDLSKIEVTKEEVDAFYKSVTSNPEVQVPPLEEVRAQVEQEIRYGKQQELISEYIDTLKKDAEVEVLI
ncbi:MAG: SurA N-terminal domain-containing protein [Candidatus Paceibacteria bacterium]